MTVDKVKLLKDLDEALKDAQASLGFKSDIAVLLDNFEIKDYFLSKGFVHESFGRALSFCMAEYYRAWIGTLHSWFFPPQGDLIHANEVKNFSSDDKVLVKSLMYQAMRFSRLDTSLIAKHDLKARARLIDEMNDELAGFNEKLSSLLDKAMVSWDKSQLSS